MTGGAERRPGFAGPEEGARSEFRRIVAAGIVMSGTGGKDALVAQTARDSLAIQVL